MHKPTEWLMVTRMRSQRCKNSDRALRPIARCARPIARYVQDRSLDVQDRSLDGRERPMQCHRVFGLFAFHILCARRPYSYRQRSCCKLSLPCPSLCYGSVFRTYRKKNIWLHYFARADYYYYYFARADYYFARADYYFALHQHTRTSSCMRHTWLMSSLLASW